MSSIVVAGLPLAALALACHRASGLVVKASLAFVNPAYHGHMASSVWRNLSWAACLLMICV
jgi:hypothetical protein